MDTAALTPSLGLISLFADDDGAQRYIKQHLNDCLAQHNLSCNRVIFPLTSAATQREKITDIVHGDRGLVVAPTRLIFVGSGEANDPPRLVAGKDCLYEGGYLVLSYCWGITPPKAPWLLTKGSMPRFATDIPMDALPQTLHDAILWTRQIGERYIWIDSMCIIQDSNEDWQREASRMASIYGSATATVVAASSSVYGGLTDRRNPLRHCAAALTLVGAGVDAAQVVYVLPNTQQRDVPAPPPTDCRAWCHQENLLSSRLVQFTRKSVVWQCVGDQITKDSRAQGLAQLKKYPQERWYTLWYRYVERYSSRHLSFAKDKLLAFYGIACDKAGTDYIAGILKSDLWASLLWCRDEFQVRSKPGQRYDQYIAPSWSWASLNSPVLFYEASGRLGREKVDTTTFDPQLLNISATHASCIETGAVRDGVLEISACAAPLRSAPSVPFLFNTRQGAHTYGRRNLVDSFSGAPCGIIVFDVASEARDGELLYCVLLHVANVGLWEKNGTAGLGVALRMVFFAGQDRTGFRRVGYVQFTSAFAQVCTRRRIKVI